MCTKPEPAEFLRPIAELTNELMQYDTNVRDFAWAGVSTFYGLLENV